MNGASRIDEHPRFRRLADYLAAKAPPGRLPGRQHVDPTELVDLLPWIVLVDVIPRPDGEPRYRLRLVGTEVVAIQGADATGKDIEAVITKSEAADILASYGEIVRSRRPAYRQGMGMGAGGEPVAYRRVAFPLARDGEHVDMLMFVFVRDPMPPRR